MGTQLLYGTDGCLVCLNSTSICNQCQDTYYLSTINVCASCSTRWCKTCNNLGCISMVYYKRVKMKWFIIEILTMSGTSCYDGYYKSKFLNYCYKCSILCKTCMSTSRNCTSCNDGLYLSNNYCYNCLTGCTNCTN